MNRLPANGHPNEPQNANAGCSDRATQISRRALAPVFVAFSGAGTGASARRLMEERFSVGVRTALVTLLLCSAAIACQVPVFRYALERWSADRYRIMVLHEEPLNESQSAALGRLRKAAETAEGVPGAVDVQLVSVAAKGKVPPALLAKWKSHEDSSVPLMLVDYPRANNVPRSEPMFLGSLTEASVDALLDSPVRREVASRLGSGDSAVWIFVPCGREADDKAARKRLDAQLQTDGEWLELPSAEELEIKPEVLDQAKVPLKIRFSALTLNRDDPAEQFLLQSLLHSEEDLLDFDQPLAFPVFGRGRVLYALVGKGIASDTIRAASAFMAGPCSCQVKNQNPGFDLLLRSNWKKTLGDVLISEPIESVDKEANAPKLLTIPPGRKAKNK